MSDSATQAAAVAQKTRELVVWAVYIRDREIPAAVSSRAARVIADSIACMIVARDEPEIARFHAQVMARGRPAEATIFRGGSHRTDRYSAAVANALADVWHELEEGYRKVPCHAGLYVLPALLAEAEALGLSLGSVLRCTAISYEVVARFAAAWDFPKMSDQGRAWVHARFNTVGAAFATALVRGQNAETTLAAVNAATTLALAGPRRHAIDGALIWNAWPAVCTSSGMMCVDWSECGIGGLPSSPYDVYGSEFSGEFDAARMTAGLGVDWAILDGYMKIHACVQYAHSAVEAVLAARDAVLNAGSVIADVLVESHPLALFLDKVDPANTLASKFSLQHIVAATFIHGNAGAAAFSSAALMRSEVISLRHKVRLAPFGPSAPPNDRPTRVTFTLATGVTVVRTCLSAEGGPDRPFRDDIVMDKIENLTREACPRFGELVHQMIALAPTQMMQPWADLVAGSLVGSDSTVRD